METANVTSPAVPTRQEEIRRFETETCSRCMGTGRYGPHVVYSGICFKCNGRKVVYTKRGAAAERFYRDLCTVKAADLKPGDRIQTIGVTNDCKVYGRVSTVVTSGPAEQPQHGTGYSTTNGVTTATEWVMDWEVVYSEGKAGNVSYTCKAETEFCRVPPAGPERMAKLVQAYDYQDTLTKAGTVRKRGK